MYNSGMQTHHLLCEMHILAHCTGCLAAQFTQPLAPRNGKQRRRKSSRASAALHKAPAVRCGSLGLMLTSMWKINEHHL